jgi:hypothetical protein
VRAAPHRVAGRRPRSSQPSNAAVGTTVTTERRGTSKTQTPAVDDELAGAETNAATSIPSDTSAAPTSVSVHRTASSARLAFRGESEASERIAFEQAADLVVVAGGLPLDRREFEEPMLGPGGQQTEDVSEVRPACVANAGRDGRVVQNDGGFGVAPSDR